MFTYDPSTPVGKVRREIQDTKDAGIYPGAGILPDGSNIEDEDIEYYLEQYANSIIGASIAVLTIVATAYSTLATETELGPYRESYKETVVNIRRQIALLERRYDDEKRKPRVAVARTVVVGAEFSNG